MALLRPCSEIRRLKLLGGATLILVAVCAVPSVLQAQERWTLSEQLRIGSLDRRGYVLTDVSGVTRDSLDNIFVGQPRYRQIWMYDESGNFVRALGRRGQGPGEFESVGRIGLYRGSIYALDRRLKRLTLLHRNGEYISSWGAFHFELPTPLMPYPPVAVLGDGSLLFRPDVAEQLQERVDSIPLARFDSTGEYVGTMAWLSWQPSPATVLRVPTATGNYMISLLPNPVQYTTIWDVAPGGESLTMVDRPPPSGVRSASFRVIRVNAKGDTLFQRRFRYDPDPISDNAWESHVQEHRQRLLDLAARMPVDADDVRQHFDREYTRPRSRTAVDRVVSGADGTVWLRRGSFGLEQSTWVVLDSRGIPVATLRLPAGVEVHWASKTTVLGVIRDEHDVPYVIRYEVKRQV